MSLFFWAITFDISGLGDPASSYATAGLALRIIWPHKPHHYVKVETSSGGSSAATGRILAEFGIWDIILISDQKVKVGLKSDTLLEDLITFNCCRRHLFALKWLSSNVIRLLGWLRRFIYFTGTRHGFTLYIVAYIVHF